MCMCMCTIQHVFASSGSSLSNTVLTGIKEETLERDIWLVSTDVGPDVGPRFWERKEDFTVRAKQGCG